MTVPVYVVLLNYNGWRDTIECLESVMRSDWKNLRVIALDNGSTDGSLDRLRAWARGNVAPHETPSASLRHLSTPPVNKPIPYAEANRSELEGCAMDWRAHRLLLVENGGNIGFAAGNNVAFRYLLKQEPDSYVLVLNNDTVIARDAITHMISLAASHDNRAVVGATLLQYHQPERIETLGGATVGAWHGHSRLIAWGTQRTGERQPARMDFLSGCCMLIPRAALERVGLLDERFFLYCEDADWGLRARSAGLLLAYEPKAEVWHKAGATAMHRSEFHDYQNVKSILHFVRKHRPLMLPAAALYLGARSVGGKMVRREWARLRAVWRGYSDFYRDLAKP